MPCSRCGSQAVGPSGACAVCGLPVSSDAPTIAAGVLTPPVPAGASGSRAGETRLDDGDAGTGLGAAPATPDDARTGLGDSDDHDRTRLGAPQATSGPAPGHDTGPLQIGQNFGPRYHIIRALGVGGMGAVYQAWDKELEVAVAVKVIRPDVASDPAMGQELERRFKRELLLARQVTHKNVVRIHDIGEIAGIKYITMPYVHGSDLASVLHREGRLPMRRALAIGRQVAAGLVAAHEAGVVHRDLKPANIMVDADDNALIMDFGIARSTGAPPAGFAATVAGVVIGTVEYMAPEQARGEAIDQRADIYAFGLILRDLLLGGRNTGATTAIAELMDRMQHPPAPVRSFDSRIPEAMDRLITRCLQPAAADRYAASAELLRDLERVAEHGPVSAGTTPASQAVTAALPVAVTQPMTAAHPVTATLPARVKRPALIPMLAGVAVVALLGVGGYAIMSKVSVPSPPTTGAAAPGAVTSLAVLPFRNASGDPSLDALGTSLSEVLATDLGEASHVRTIPTERLHHVLGDLQIDRRANLSPRDLGRIADFATAQSIVWGQFVKFGDEIRIDATLQNLAQGKTTPLKATAPNQAALLTAVGQLAESVQQALAAGSADVLNELKATAWRPSTQSFEALRLYNEGQELERDGNHQEAQKRFEAAVADDANFALAYSAMAQSYANLGYDAQAAQYSRRAVSLSESLPPQEKYLIAASHYRITNDPGKGIETYEKLVQGAPNNASLQFELGGLYEQTGKLEKAQEHYQRVVQLDPKYVEGLTAVGRIAIKRGDPQSSLQPLNNALSLAISLNNDVARANVLQAIGIAYKRLGRPKDALKQYQDSLAIKRQLGQKRGMAVSLTEIAQIQEQLGSSDDAVKSYNEALALDREIGDKAGTATALLNLGGLLSETMGQPDKALPLLREALAIAREQGDRSLEGLGLNLIGSAYNAKGEYSDAQTYFERSLELREAEKVPREIADTLHNLGETLNKMGKYDQALARYLRALELRRSDGDKRAEGIESYSMGTIFDYQGRYGAAVKSKGEALQVFRDLGQKDVWFAEVLSGYGYSLALAGRSDDAAKSLEEALGDAKLLQNQGLISQTYRYQAARIAYTDSRAAMRLAEQAAQIAGRASDRTLDVWARAELAATSAAAQPTRATAAALLVAARQAETQGLTYLSVYCAMRGAEAFLKAGDHAQARQTVDRTLAQAETLGLRELQARGEYVLATTMRAAKDGQARRHYALALQLLDEMAREEGNAKVLDRPDLKAIHAECAQWSKV